MAQAKPQQFFTPEEYLVLERAAAFKSEYVEGQIYAMAGSSPTHSTITVNVTGEVRAQLKGKRCQAFSNDMKVGTDGADQYAYPDLSVVCGKPRYRDKQRDVLINPTLIIEVLSPSTEGFDRRKKFARYQILDAFSDYVLIAQDTPHIEHFSKQADGSWRLTATVTGLENHLPLPSIGCTLALAEIYDRVEFDDDAEA